MLISSLGIGGSERRIVKVATHISSLKVFKRVHLLVNAQLMEAYESDQELNTLLQESTVDVCQKEDLFEKRLFSDANKIRFIKRVHPYAKRSKSFHGFILKRLSWFRMLKRRTGDEDVIHCFFGDPARNGCLFLATTSNRKIIVELTSNRLLPRVSSQINTILGGKRANKTLNIRCVSKTVHDNFTKLVPTNFCKRHNVDLGYYSGPFIQSRAECERKEKENVIIYAHRFIEPKNPILFCGAVRELLDNNELPGWRIKLRGRGSLEPEMRHILGPYIDEGIVDIGFSYTLGDELARSKVFVSIITTGNYPSQSVFEAMRNGNLLVLSRTGETESQYEHPNVCFVGLDQASVAQGLREASSCAESAGFERRSESMRDFFDRINTREGYMSDALRMYSA